MLYLQGQCHITPDVQKHHAKEVTQQAATGTGLAAVVTTISYHGELACIKDADKDVVSIPQGHQDQSCPVF
eukprot:superscaffoldBa00000983_g8346